MNKISISTFVFLGFCLNILLIIFLPEGNNTVNLVIRLTAVAGLIWLIYFYFQFLGLRSLDNNSIDNIPDEFIDVDQSAKTQFLDLIELTFSTIKDINIEFEIGIYFIDPSSNDYILKDSTSKDFSDKLKKDSSILAKILISNEIIIIYQKDNSSEWNELFGTGPWRGSECVIVQPLLFNGNNTGSIIVKSEHFSDLNAKDQLLIKHLSEIISLSIKDLDILEKTISQAKDQSQIFDLLTNINLSHSESEILNKFRNVIHYFFNYDCLTISMIDNSGKIANVKLVDGIKKNLPESNEFNINGTINGLPYAKKMLINESSSKYNLFRFSSLEKVTSSDITFIGAPLNIDEKLWGAIMIENFSGHIFSKNDEKLLSLIVRALEASMHWHMEYQNMYENAIKDGLTGLLNHKTFVDRAREEIERARRFQHHLVFLMYDLDKFKRINDTLGHPYGDYVIKNTAKIIKDNVRSIDLVARYGGEEFAVVLVNTTTEAALTVAQRIVDNIADYNFNMENKEVNMTISSGLSEYPNDSDRLKDLIQYADQGLYKTKENGGNGVTIYQSLIS
jgi:diguanylate cyclase (GGDEF)-like protein